MSKASQIGIMQALGVTAYCTLVGILMNNGDRIFGRMDNFLGPIVFVLLFSVSVLVCGLLVFYQPYQLFSAGRKNEAARVVLSTVAYLFAILVVLMVIVIAVK